MGVERNTGYSFFVRVIQRGQVGTSFDRGLSMRGHRISNLTPGIFF